MAKRARETYTIKGVVIEEWQIFDWTCEATLTPYTFRDDGELIQGETYKAMCTDGAYIVKGFVFYATNGGYAKINGVRVTPEFIDQDEKSKVVPKDSFILPPWEQYPKH